MKKKILLPVTFLVMVLMALPLSAVDKGFIKLEDKAWKASVFGDVGGDEVITEENFLISQNGDSFTLASRNNRGKFSSTTDGLAFLYKEISGSKDFEMTVSAEVKSFDMNNQVSFGIMLRDTVYENMATKENLGTYLAVGPIDITKEPALTVFYRTTTEKATKLAPMAFTAKPASGSVVEISFIKEGNTYTLTYGDEDPFVIEDFTKFGSDKLYIGLFTSRNTEVVYSDINLDIQ